MIASPWSRPMGTGWQSVRSHPLRSRRTTAVLSPMASIAAIIKLLTKTAVEDVRLRRSKSLLEVSAPGFILTSKLIDATYPDYARVIPATPANSATVDHADLVAALARLDAVAEHETKGCRISSGFAWDPAEPVLRLSSAATSPDG